MNFVDYALHHIHCVWRLARGESAALGDMDISADGFWRSFEAIPAALPALMFSWVTEARQLQADGVAGSLFGMVTRMAALEIVFWILPVVGLALVIKPLGFARRFSHLVIARNWLSALASYIYLIVPAIELLFNGGNRDGATAWLSLLAMGIVIWLTIRVTRIALNAAVAVALAFVAAETILLLPLVITSYGWAGLYPPV